MDKKKKKKKERKKKLEDFCDKAIESLVWSNYNIYQYNNKNQKFSFRWTKKNKSEDFYKRL